MSYKSMLKSLGYNRNDYQFNDSESLYQKWYDYYYNYFTRLITNRFKWEGLPLTVDTSFLETNLSLNGYIGIYEDDKLGLIVSNGAKLNLDIYNNPTRFKPIFQNVSHDRRERRVFSYSDPIETYQKGDVIIIQNNNVNQSSFDWLGVFCDKLANLEVAKEVNRVQLMLPSVFLYDEDSHVSIKQLIAQVVGGGVPFLEVKKLRNNNGLSDKSVVDDFRQFPINVDFLLDKLSEEIERIISDVLTITGINHLGVAKKERVVVDEVQKNEEEINYNLDIELESRQKACDLINVVFKDVLDDKVTVKINNELNKKSDKQLEQQNDIDWGEV